MKSEQDEFTLDLFGAKPLTGLELGHAMAKVAADNAGEQWKKMAYESFVEYAKHHSQLVSGMIGRAGSGDPPLQALRVPGTGDVDEFTQLQVDIAGRPDVEPVAAVLASRKTFPPTTSRIRR